MRRPRSPRLTTIALGALLALVPTFLSFGLHSGPESIAGSTLEPTTVYISQHRAEVEETHLHAEVGYESVFCLACFTSLRNQSLLGGQPNAVAMSDLGASAPALLAALPVTPPVYAFSPRAPPRA